MVGVVTGKGEMAVIMSIIYTLQFAYDCVQCYIGMREVFLVREKRPYYRIPTYTITPIPIPEYPKKSIRVWVYTRTQYSTTSVFRVSPIPTRNLIFLLGCEPLVSTIIRLQVA